MIYSDDQLPMGTTAQEFTQRHSIAPDDTKAIAAGAWRYGGAYRVRRSGVARFRLRAEAPTWEGQQLGLQLRAAAKETNPRSLRRYASRARY